MLENVCLSNFWRTLEMYLINFEINLILTWSACCVISERNREKTLAITHTKHYALVVTLTNQINSKILQELKSGFKISDMLKHEL